MDVSLTQCEEARYHALIETARKALDVGTGAFGSAREKHLRIDGSDPWTMLELGDPHDDDRRPEAGKPHAGLFALLHTLPADAARP